MAKDTVLQFGASFLDSEQVKATTTAHLYMDGGQTVTQVKTALANWAGALDLITGAKITETRARIIGPGVTNGAKPIAGAEVQEAGVFDFKLGATPYHWGLVVPAILETLTSAGGKISPTGDVAALIALMLTDPILGGNYTGLDTTSLSAFQRSFEGSRSKRRQVFRASVNYTAPS